MKRSILNTHVCASTLIIAASLLVPAQSFAQSAAENVKYDEIIVTARKREETVLEIPVSVTAFSQDALDDLGITDASTLSDFTPGFKFENSGTGGFSGRSNPQIRFRGISVQASTPASQAGAIFWDGAYISAGAGVIPLIDVERVEVIKGPQTAFFGRNTFSGAVNYIPAEPTEEMYVKLIGGISGTDNDYGHEITGIFNGAIAEDLTARIAMTNFSTAADYEYTDGSPLGEYDNTTIFGTLKYSPSDNFSLKYNGTFVNAEDNSVQVSQPGTVAAADCNAVYSGQYRDVATGAITGTFTTDLGANTFSGSYPGSTPSTIESSSLSTAFSGGQCGTIEDWGDIPFEAPDLGTPSDLSLNDLANFFGTDYANQDGLLGVQAPMLEFGGDLEGPPDGFGNTYDYTRHHASLEYEMDNGHSIDAFISGSNNQAWTVLDANFGTGATYRVEGYASLTEDMSVEARISSPGDQKVRYTVGLSHFTQDSILGNYGTNNVLDQSGENQGIFGSVDVDMTEALTLSAEGRFARDEQTINYEGLPADKVGAIRRVSGVDTVLSAADAVRGETQSYEEFMPRVILSYQPTSDLNIYGSWSNSFIQGAATGAAFYGSRNPLSGINEDTVGFFTPVQELTSLELGIKQNIGDNFNYSASLYQMDWTNQVFFELDSAFTSVFLPGDSEYTGLDAEFRYDAADWVRLTGGLSIIDAEFTEFGTGGTLAFRRLSGGVDPIGFSDTSTIPVGSNIDAAGNTPRYTPELTASFSANFDTTGLVGLDSYAVVSAVHTGDFFVDNLNFNQVDAFTKFNARFGAQITDIVSGEIYVNNITDDTSWNTSGGTTGFFSRKTFGDVAVGRVVGIKATAEFQ